jgi:hypothetical protein
MPRDDAVERAQEGQGKAEVLAGMMTTLSHEKKSAE